MSAKKPTTYKKLFAQLEELHRQYFLAEVTSSTPKVPFVTMRKRIEDKQREIESFWMSL